MKKRLSVLALLICILVTLTGCSVTSEIAWCNFKIVDATYRKTYDKVMEKQDLGFELHEKDHAKYKKARVKAQRAYNDYLQACVASGELKPDQIPEGCYGDRAETLAALSPNEESVDGAASEDSSSVSALDKSTVSIIIIAIVIIGLLLLLLMRKKQPKAYAVPVVNTPQVIPPSVTGTPQPYVGYYDQNTAMQEINSYCAANNLDTQTFIKQCGSVDAAIVTIRGYQ